MSDLVAKLRLEGNASGMVGATDQATKAVGRFASAAKGAGATTGQLDRDLGQVAGAAGRAGSGLGAAALGAERFERSASLAQKAGFALGGALAAIGGRELVASLGSAALAMQGFDTSLSAVAGGTAGAAQAQAFLREESARLGLVVREQTGSFVALAGATKGTRLEGQATRDIWLAVVEAGAALSRSNEEQKRGLEAISQIASKGVVSMEEIRQQLAEAIPGAVQIGARAMGVTTAEFNKMVAAGKLLSEDFLPKFAAQLHKEFGQTLETAMNTPLGHARRELAAFKNALFDIEGGAGSEFLVGFTQGLTGLNAALTDPAAREAAKDVGRELGQGLSTAASVAGFLVENIHAVEAALGGLVAIGVGKWLATVAAETTAATIAMAANGVTGGAAAKAQMTLTAALQLAARAELQAATAAQALAVADEEVAATALMAARAFEAEGAASAVAMAAEVELTAARTAVAAAGARVAAANAAVAGSTSALAGAGALARGAMGSLVSMMGGPLGFALTATAGGIWALSAAMAEDERIQKDLTDGTTEYATAMAQAEQYLHTAADGSKKFGDANAAAVAGTDDLAGATLRLANALAQARYQQLTAVVADRQAAIDKLDNPGLGVVTGRALRGTINALTGVPTLDTQAAQRAELVRQRDNAFTESVKVFWDPKSNDPSGGAPPPAATLTGKAKADKLEDKAKQARDDLLADKAATEAYIAAVQKGPAAIAEWKAQEAGRQAVERLGLSNRTKLTAGEKALLETIRQAAVDTERLKQSAERMEAGATLQRQAELDTEALKRRQTALAQGEQAVEDLRVKEAGLAAQQQLGIQNLEALKGADLDQAKAAIAAAEAKEKQAIATEKAARVAATLDDLDRQIKSQQAYAAALAGGEKALVEYTIAEEVRQETEKAGHTLDEEQIATIRRKTLALLGLKALNDASADKRQFEQDLRLASMTADERERELRALQLRDRLLRENPDRSEDAALAQARAQAAWEQAQMRRAADIGKLKDDLRQAYIESGHLGFDSLKDYAEKKLREAIYDAFLAKPIDLVINATVNVVGQMANQILGGGLSKLLGGAGSLASGAGFGGLGSLLSSASGVFGGGFAGGIGAVDAMGNAAGGLSGLLGSAGGLLGPIGLGIGLISMIAGHKKPSNNAAVATFSGDDFSIAGSKRTAKTEGAISGVAGQVEQMIASLRAVGIEAGGTIKSVEIGVRDKSRLRLNDGEVIRTAKGDAQALTEAAAKALLKGGVYNDPNMKKVVDQLLAANKSFDQIASTLTEYVQAQSLGDDLKLQLLKFTDPRAAALKELENQQKARRDAVDAYAKQGFYTDTQLADIKSTLTALDSAELASTLAKLGDAASDAAKALQQAKPSLREWLDQLTQSAAAPVNAFEQRGLASAQYDRVLEQARAGDATALGNLTSYAERLIEADRNASSDAQERLALYNRVTSDIAQLAAPDSPATQAAAIEQLTTTNSAVTLQAAQQVVEAVSGSDGVVAAVEALGSEITASLARVEAALGGGLDGVGEATGQGLGSLIAAVAQQTDALTALGQAQRSTNALLQMTAVRP